MGALTLRVNDTVRDELIRAARTRGTTVSELLRGAIDDLLGFSGGNWSHENDVAVPKTLDVVERRMFSLLHEVLSRLVDSERARDEHLRQAEVMAEGFAGEYYTEFGHMSVELTPTECDWVNDILEMFRDIEFCLAQLTSDDRKRLGADADYTLIFDGFDQNKPDEVRLLDYARHMVKKEGHWQEFRERLTTDERGNSHSPRRARYQQMYTAYEAIRDRKRANNRVTSEWNFDVEDLLLIMEAARR